MNVCLMYPLSLLPVSTNSVSVPLGIYVVGSILKARGETVTIWDQSYFRKYLAQHPKLDAATFTEDPEFRSLIEETDVICLSCDSFNYGMARLIITAARQVNDRLKVIMGGIHPSLLPEHVAKTSDCDVVFRGECEGRILELLDCLREERAFGHIGGLTYRDSDGSLVKSEDPGLCSTERLAELSSIDYSLIPSLDSVKSVPVETSRGCLYRCTFCSVLFKGKRRLFPLERVKQNIQAAVALKQTIFITDDCLTFESDRAQAVLSFVNDLDHCTVHFEARASDLCRDGGAVLEAVKRERVGGLQIGVECGYDEGLRKIRKGITTAQVEKACHILAEHGMAERAFFSFIIGFPWEGVKECVRTLDFARDIRAKYGVGVNTNFWIPAPSELWFESAPGFGVDASMYDEMSWFVSDELFAKTHPMIGAKEKVKINYLRSREGLVVSS